MTQPRASNGQFRRAEKGERYRQQFELLHGPQNHPQLDDWWRAFGIASAAVFYTVTVAIIARAI